MTVIERSSGADPCDGCDGSCGDVCPVWAAKRESYERIRPEAEVERLSRQLAGAVEPNDEALALYTAYMEAAANDGYAEKRLLRDGLRQILVAQWGR